MKNQLSELKLEEIDRKIQEAIDSHLGDRPVESQSKQDLSKFLDPNSQVKAPKFTIDNEITQEEPKP